MREFCGEVREQVFAGDDQPAEVSGGVDRGRQRISKKGTHSVGVARQYCGQLGKQENCRVAVSVSLATEQASLPAASRLYLPQLSANDRRQRKRGRRSRRNPFPNQAGDRSRTDSFAGQRRCAARRGSGRCRIWQRSGDFREGLEALELSYAVGIQSSTTVWPPDMKPLRRHRKARWDVRPVCCSGIDGISRFRPKCWLSLGWGRIAATPSSGARARAARCAPLRRPARGRVAS